MTAETAPEAPASGNAQALPGAPAPAGSLQLRRYRVARRAGVATAEAEALAGLVPGEGALVDAEDALNPPAPECFQLPGETIDNATAMRRALGGKRFGAILADPPWAFRTFSGENMTPHRCAEDHYRTLTLEQLAALPVGEFAAKDCALFMWLVGSHLAEGIELARAWGFEFKTDAFYWLKQRMIDADQVNMFTGDIAEPRISFGYWTRKQVEPCWLFTRGNPRRRSASVRQAIIAPRREHSRKPDEQYARIEALVGGPYLELFARTVRPGWNVWGNEVGKFEASA